MLSIRSAIPSALVTIALAGSAYAAPLAYRFPAGSAFELDTVVDATAPVVGPKHIEIKAAVHVDEALADGMKLTQTITAGGNNVTVGCQLSAEGRITNITGGDLNDPKFALIAKNAGTALPALPNEEPTVGMTWQDEKPLALPKLPIPGVPDTLRITSSYKVTAIAKVGDQQQVTIAVVIDQSPGQKMGVHAEGAFVLDAATGKPVTSHLEGEAQVKVILKTFKIPFKADISVK